MATSENSCTTSKIRRVRRGAALGIHLGVQALEVSKAAPPWLPFVAFANVMAAKDEQGEFFWRNETSRALLERFAERHLRRRPSWAQAVHAGEWLSELLRGLCDRLAKIFLEESFMDSLVASVLWSFSASFMPAECQAVCWGSDDLTLLRFLDRALPCASPLLWQVQDYTAPEGANAKLAKLSSLGSSSRSWPRVIAQTGNARTEKVDLESLE
ncbi:unnamed protein product [Durusdinium trenchii]|uniref:Uncharacterized protein n=1 Tax=Durusdinium trenchii TaxID=1381693 RepID=A0ABP0MBL6_9DINO